ncbi:MAG: hypothetical protein QOG25_2509 [Acetobacteraceae bacterium]|jgi:hypothetical protein|nr:hypothetical protein [Acetobacteraceae bacterium]
MPWVGISNVGRTARRDQNGQHSDRKICCVGNGIDPQSECAHIHTVAVWQGSGSEEACGGTSWNGANPRTGWLPGRPRRLRLAVLCEGRGNPTCQHQQRQQRMARLKFRPLHGKRDRHRGSNSARRDVASTSIIEKVETASFIRSYRLAVAPVQTSLYRLTIWSAPGTIGLFAGLPDAIACSAISAIFPAQVD